MQTRERRCAAEGVRVWRCVEEGALFGARWCEDVWRKVRCGGGVRMGVGGRKFVGAGRKVRYGGGIRMGVGECKYIGAGAHLRTYVGEGAEKWGQGMGGGEW